jgi:ribosome-associated toxin RatA of RatAB toxin-antitoxin module
MKANTLRSLITFSLNGTNQSIFNNLISGAILEKFSKQVMKAFYKRAFEIKVL